MRRILTILFVLFGLGLMIAGYLFSAPWGAVTVSDSDPAFPGAPALFAIGIISILVAVLVYELLPSRDDDRVG